MGAPPLKVLSLFAGIGGFDLGLERTGGFKTVAFCEIEPFCQRVLAKHWPEVPIYDDVRALTAERLAADGVAVDVITGGFPCQDISVAGKRAGITEGTRSGLWSEFARLIGELRPRYVIVENVAGLLNGPPERPGAWFGRVLGDLAERGYDAEWENIPAATVGASHRRERVWIVAYSASERCGKAREHCERSEKRTSRLRPIHGSNANGDGLETLADQTAIRQPSIFGRCAGRLGEVGCERWQLEPRPLGVTPLGVGDGFSEELGAIRAYGNAVVPQIPELIGRAILASLEAERAAA